MRLEQDQMPLDIPVFLIHEQFLIHDRWQTELECPRY